MSAGRIRVFVLQQTGGQKYDRRRLCLPHDGCWRIWPVHAGSWLLHDKRAIARLAADMSAWSLLVQPIDRGSHAGQANIK